MGHLGADSLHCDTQGRQRALLAQAGSKKSSGRLHPGKACVPCDNSYSSRRLGQGGGGRIRMTLQGLLHVIRWVGSSMLN